MGTLAAAAAKQLSMVECDQILCRPGSQFEVETVDIRGHPTTVWKNSPTSFRDHLLSKYGAHADRVFVNAPLPEPADPTQRELFTYAEIQRRAVDLAAWLVARGVRCQDPVGLVGFNSCGWVVGFSAILLVGAVPVMANAAIQPDAIVHCLKIARPKVVLTDAVTAATLSFHRDELTQHGITEVVSWQNADHLKHKGVTDIDLSRLPVPASAARAILAGTGFGLETHTPENDATIFFTSGTTGYPKAVVSSHRAALHNVISSVHVVMRAGLRMGGTLEQVSEMVLTPPPEQGSLLMAVPFFHVTGCLSMLLKSITDGNQVVLMRRWNVDEAVRLLTTYKVNLLGGVPAIMQALLQSNLPKDHVISGMSFGGAPAPARLPADLMNRWPELGMVTAWGMTETNAPHTVIVGQDYLNRPKSCGYPLPVAEVRIVDPTTKVELPVGKAGLIQARGMTMMTGYYNDPEANRKSIDKDGWFDTGDAGYLDSEGFLFIADRIKDIIIRGGENISSEEVENAIYLDDRIAEAAAVPVPDELLGELVAVAVSLRPGAKATAQQIIANAHSRLRSHARPVFVWVSPDLLPRNANGKLVKSEIKKTVAALYQQQQKRAKL